MEQHNLEYDGVTFIFANTLRAVLRFLRMTGRQDARLVDGKPVEIYLPGKFTNRDEPDYHVVNDFCWVVAHLESVRGWNWQIPRETDTPELFLRQLNAFADRIDLDTLAEVFVPFVNGLKKSNASVIERPDAELTDEERNDPE